MRYFDKYDGKKYQVKDLLKNGQLVERINKVWLRGREIEKCDLMSDPRLLEAWGEIRVALKGWENTYLEYVDFLINDDEETVTKEQAINFLYAYYRSDKSLPLLVRECLDAIK